MVTIIPTGSLDLQSPTLLGQAAPSGNGNAIAEPGAAAEGKIRLSAAIAALGGDAFLTLKQVTLKGAGEITPPGSEMTVPVAAATLTFAAPSKSRVELNTTFGDVIFGSDGTNKPWLSALGAIQDGPMGFSDPTELFRRAIRHDYEVTALPDTKEHAVGEMPLQGLMLKDEKKHITKIYLDAQTHLPRRISTETEQGALDILLSDYHAAEKVMLPGTLKVAQGGKPFVSLKFTVWEINRPVDAKQFERPKA
jgi:hypothetical protein